MDPRSADGMLSLIADLPIMWVRTRSENGAAVVDACNQQFLDRLGYDREEVVGTPLASLYDDESAHQLAQSGYEKALVGKFTSEHRTFVAADGTRVHTLLQATPVEGEGGEPGGTNAIYVDITERFEYQQTMASIHEEIVELFRATAIDEIAASVRDAAEEVLGYAANSVRLVEDGMLVPVEMGSDRDQYDDVPAYSVDGLSPAAQAYREGDPVVFDDLRTAEDDHDRGELLSSIHLPLGEYGVLGIATTEQAAFDQTDVQLAEILTSSATAALDRARREQDLAEREEKLARFLEIVHEVITADDVETASERAVEAVADVFDMPLTAIWIWDEFDETLRPAASTDRAESVIGGIPSFDGTDGSIAWETFHSGEVEVFDDVRNATSTYNPSTPVRSEIAIPLGDFGILLVGKTEPAAFERVDVAFANLVGTHLRAALSRIDHERELETARDRLALALEGTDTGLFTWDIYTDTFSWNETLLDLVGMSQPVDNSLETLLDRVHPDDRAQVREALDAATATGSYDDTFRIWRLDGEMRWLRLRADVVHESGEPARLIGLMTDVTERQQRRQHLDVLARLMRHNMRNDLTVIRGKAEALEASLDAGEGTEITRSIIRMAEQWESTIDKSQQIHRVLDGDAANTATNLEDTLSTIGRELAVEHPDASVSVDFEPTDTVPCPVEVELAVRELCENGIVHDPSTAAVTVTVEAGEETVTVTVRDTGPGIHESELRSLQEGDETPLEHGSGLGFWMVRLMTLRVGGEVRVETTGEDGTEIVLRYPRES